VPVFECGKKQRQRERRRSNAYIKSA
jgi:hypothetical protein